MFQALVNDVLHDYLSTFCVCILDDVFIFSSDLESHVQHVCLVLQRLLSFQLFVKAEKCKFHAPTVSFLGFTVAEGEVHMDQEKVRAVSEWPAPTNRQQMQRFLS